MASTPKERLHALLRWSERYTKTDMVYLFEAGFWVNSNIIVASILGLLLSIALANLLAPATYGLYQYLLSLSVLIAAISLAGMNSTVAQATARGYEGVLRAAVRVQLRWSLVPALISFVGACYYLSQGNSEVGIGLIAIAVFTPLGNACNTYIGFLEGRRAFRRAFLLGTFVTIVSYVSLFLAVIWVRSAAALIIINLGTNTLAMAYAYYRTLRWVENDRVDLAAISYGKHLSIMSGFTTIMNQVDSILVFHFLGATELAVYSLATMLPERAGTLFNFIGTASFPKFATQPLAKIQQTILNKLLRVAFGGAIAAALYVFLAPLLFRLLFPGYLASIPFSVAYAPIIALIAITSVANATLVAKRLTREIYIVSFLQPLLLVGLQIPLLLLYGLWGMIIARLATDSVGIVIALLLTFHPLRETEDVV